MKKPLFITILLFGLIAGGYFAYNHYFAKPVTAAWDLIPSETVLVYESSPCTSCVQAIKNSPVAEIIRKTSQHSTKDSITVLQDLILSFQQSTLVSLHLTRKDEFDFVYYLPYTPGFAQKFNSALETMAAIKGSGLKTRIYNSITINELSFAGRVFSWVTIDEQWAGSFSPVLIEDVVRTYDNQENSFRSVVGNIYQLPRIKNDGGNLYVHLSNLSELFSLFTSEKPGPLLGGFGHSALLDSKIADNRIVLNGFSSPAAKSNLFLSSFQEQTPVPFALRNVISNRTMMVTSYGISDGSKFFKRLNETVKNPSTDSLTNLFKTYNIDGSKLYQGFSGEVALCLLEGRKESFTSLLLVHDTKGTARWKEMLSKVSASVIADTVFIDRYSSYEIFNLPVYQFPQKLFYPLVTGFDNSYYTFIGNTLCIAEDIEELKKFLSDIDQENTWGKSVEQNKYLETTLLESNISLFINTPRMWTVLGNNLKPKWKQFITDNENLLNSLGMGAIQFSHLNDTYYTNISWVLSEYKPSGKPKNTDRYITTFESGISKLFATRNHNDKSGELLLQDSSNYLSLVGQDGKVEWKIQLDGFIQGDVQQIDYLNNGKLQFYFVAAGAIHLIDRLGNPVNPYPIKITENIVDFVSVVDYDHSKKYRFLIASGNGKIWMYDKEGKNLEGWQPRSVDEGLSTAPNHHRILGKDYLLAVRKDGVVFLMNRRGELIKNFPLDLNTRVSGDYFLDRGRNSAETNFIVVSPDGVRYQFNMQGKITGKEVLVKNAPEAMFSLIAEKEGKSYVIIRKEPKQFSVFNEAGKEIVKSDYISGNTEVNYYAFGNGKEYITVTDKGQQLSYIFDKTGKMVNPVPIDSDNIRMITGPDEKPVIFSAYNGSVTIFKLP